MQVGDKDKNGRPMGARFLLSIFARSDFEFRGWNVYSTEVAHLDHKFDHLWT